MYLVLFYFIVHLFGLLSLPVATTTDLASHLEWTGSCGLDDYADDIASNRNELLSRRKTTFNIQNITKYERNKVLLANQTVVVRLSVTYDASMEVKYGKGLRRFIRDLIYSTQLVFDQTELGLKIKLIVTKLKKSQTLYGPDISVNSLLSDFGNRTVSNDTDGIDIADLNVLLMHRNLWSANSAKTLGLSNVGQFCVTWPYNNIINTLVINAAALGYLRVFAHELAHSFNVNHDSYDKEKDEANSCDKNKNIMSPSVGPGKTRWSDCTKAAMFNFFAYERVFDCINDPTRISSAKPVSPGFDFDKIKEPPGLQLDIDKQCQMATHYIAKSEFSVSGKNVDRFTTCELLVCRVGHARIDAGHAIPGSTCSKPAGKCLDGSCKVP